MSGSSLTQFLCSTFSCVICSLKHGAADQSAVKQALKNPLVLDFVPDLGFGFTGVDERLLCVALRSIKGTNIFLFLSLSLLPSSLFPCGLCSFLDLFLLLLSICLTLLFLSLTSGT